MNILLKSLFLIVLSAGAYSSQAAEIKKGGYIDETSIRYYQRTDKKYEVKCPSPAVNDVECSKSYADICIREGFLGLGKNDPPWRTCLTVGDIKTEELSDYCFTQTNIYCM